MHGLLSFVYVIQLVKFEQMLDIAANVFATRAKNKKAEKLFDYLFRKTYSQIRTIKGVPKSVDWIDSVWTWIAGILIASD